MKQIFYSEKVIPLSTLPFFLPNIAELCSRNFKINPAS